MNTRELTEKACRWFKQYKAIYRPRCNCKPCHDKYEKTQQQKNVR